MDKPTVGQLVYVPSSLYIDHGQDDFFGGMCEITTVKQDMSAGKLVPFVSVRERSGHGYNYQYLLEEQARHKDCVNRGYSDPDPSVHFMWYGFETCTINTVRHVLAFAPENLRQKARKAGIDIYKAEESDALRLLGYRELLPLLIGIDSRFDALIEKVLK